MKVNVCCVTNVVLTANPVLLRASRGNAQVHRGAAADQQSAAVHQPAVGGLQELRKVSGTTTTSQPTTTNNQPTTTGHRYR